MSLNNSPDLGLEQSKYSDLVAFTSTFYKDDVEWRVRSEACFEMLDNAQKLDIRVVVWDGGSDWEFIKRLWNYPNITLVHSGKWWENTDLTMAGERRFTGSVAMKKYSDASYFLWLEPEKADLISEKSIDAILDPMRNWEADIVVPSRKSKDTLPPQQRAAENRANRRAIDIVETKKMSTNKKFRNRYKFWVLPTEHDDRITIDKIYIDNENWAETPNEDKWRVPYNGRMNASYDLWFGPKAFTRSSMEEDFLSYKWAKWDGIITSVVKWILDGKKVVDVPVEFSYPQDQTQLETDPAQAEMYRKKRRIQYRYIMKTIRDMVRNKLENSMK